jgi:hypothetical protein
MHDTGLTYLVAPPGPGQCMTEKACGQTNTGFWLIRKPVPHNRGGFVANRDAWQIRKVHAYRPRPAPGHRVDSPAPGHSAQHRNTLTPAADNADNADTKGRILTVRDTMAFPNR